MPEKYDFEPLLNALNKYEHYTDYHKYKHNYDYQLALLMMSNKFYMTNGTILFSENTGLFTAISQVNYEYYKTAPDINSLRNNPDIQCVVANNGVPFGEAQKPALTDYADGINTLQFALEL